MGEVSDEIELDLGLSIGRSFRKSEDPKPIEKEPAIPVQRSGGNVCVLENSSHAPSSTAGSGGAVLDPETKREIHALRRQEAKRKREEKQQKRGQSKARNGEMCFIGGSSVSDEAPPQDEVRARVREQEEELDAEEKQCKKNKIESNGSMNPNSNQGNVGSEPMGYASSPPYPIMQMRFPYPPIQYVPISNGFAIPYVMPCWAPNGAASGGGGSEKAVAQPVAWRSFVPFQANLGSGVNLANGCESEQNGSGGNRKASSNGSPMCSSSVVSDNRSSSHEGVNSSETRSHSSHPLPQMADVAKVQFDHSGSSNIVQATESFVKAGPVEKPAASNISSPNPPRPNEKPTISNMLSPNPARPNEKAAASNMNLARPTEKAAPAPAASNMLPPNPTGTNGGEVNGPKFTEKPVLAEAELESQPSPAKNKPVSSPKNQKEAGGEMGKAPKPQTENQSSPSLPQMPCVSTTGNGPNGKTITGLLYRYTQAEVSIVCVCHGNSFSPAEFVAHAGGTDVSNPLKHITVVPSSLG